MLIDSVYFDSGRVIRADVCIVGAGPAGLSVARSLADSGLRVAVLESGGLKKERKTDALSKGQLSGMLDQKLHHMHARQLGGTANHWILKMADKRNGYRHTPLDPIDFERRDFVPYSGWPISRAELDSYYERVHDLCEIGPYDYAASAWHNEGACSIFDETICGGVFSFGPTEVFTEKWPRFFASHQNIDIHLHATVVELLAEHEGHAVHRAVVRHANGREIYYEAQVFVIAAGGLDTPRLLLSSNRQAPRGLGNRHDVVGRYYIDHSLVLNGYFYPEDPSIIRRLAFYDMRLVEDASILGKVVLREQVMWREGLRNIGVMLFPKPTDREQRAFESLQQIVSVLHGAPQKKASLALLADLIRGSDYVAHVLYQRFFRKAGFMPGLSQGGWSRLPDLERRFQRLEMLSLVEQSPNPDNRVTLSDERDALGCARINLHMDWSQEDLDSVRRAQGLIVASLQKAGLGRFESHEKDGELNFYSRTAHHIMGTARMGNDPLTSVVDANCRVHDVTNLYVASSAVFPTGGHANPTLTLLALSVRLADRIRAQLSPWWETAATSPVA